MRWSSRDHFDFERDYLDERYVPHGWPVVIGIVIFLSLWIAIAISVYREMPSQTSYPASGGTATGASG
jgi:hypothetical protein